MAWTYKLFLIVLFWILKITEGQHSQVTCVISERCILPCTTEPHGGVEVIHWYNTNNNDNPVHSYYLGEEHFEHQDPKYRGRTSLFKDLISSGNVSLLLTDVKVQDEGEYKCYTSTSKGNEEKFVDLKVEGPMKSVDITLDTDTLTCSSEGFYPTPTLVWSTDPPSQIQPETAPETQSNGQGLFSITSSVKKTSNSTYICTVTAGQNTRTSSLKQQSLSAKEGEELIIPCSVPGANANLKDFTLTWLFNGDTVLTYDSHTSQNKVHGRWQDHVKYTDKETEIKLYNLNDNTFSGRYSCEVVTTKFRHLQETLITQDTNSSGSVKTAGIITGIITGIVVMVLLVCVASCIIRQRSQSHSESNGQESQPMKDSV